MINDTDGNLAALRQYERQCERQDLAWEYVLARIQPKLDAIELLVDECLSEADEQEYDFEEQIRECIAEAIEG